MRKENCDPIEGCGHPNIIYSPFGFPNFTQGDGGTTPPVSPFTPEYQAVLDYATLQGYALPSAGVQTLQNQLIVDLKAAGIWVELDIYYNFLTDGDVNFAKINWKAPGTFQAVGTGHEPTYNLLSGFKGNGTTQYLALSPLNAGGKYQALNASLFGDVSGGVNGGAFLGIREPGGSGNSSFILPNPTNILFQINEVISGVQIVNGGGVNGMYHVRKTTALASTVFKNGVNVGVSSGQAGVAVSGTHTLFALARNFNAGTPEAFSDQTIHMAGKGSSLAGNELSLYNAWINYKAAIISNNAYKAIIDYATAQLYTLPSAANQTKQKKLIYDLVVAGVWDELDVFYNFITDGSSNFAKINWKNPATFYAVGTGHEPTFTPVSGFLFAPSKYLDTQYIPNTAIKFTLNDASFFIDHIGGASAILGAGGGGVTSYYWVASFVYGVISAANDSLYVSSSTPGGGFRHVKRDLTALTLFKEGVLSATAAPAILSKSTLPIFIGARNGLGGTADSTAKCFGAGASLTGKELALYNAWATYKTVSSQYSENKILFVGTDGAAKGFSYSQFGTLTSNTFAGLEVETFDLRLDSVLQFKMMGGIKIQSVDNIRVFIEDEIVDLTWNGVDQYEGMAPPPAAAKFIVSNFATITLLVSI